MIDHGRVVFVRHALPAVDEMIPSRLWPLTEDGRLAAERLASRLQLPSDELVWASEELKARQTAEALSNPVVVDPRLVEVQRPWTGGDYRKVAELWLSGRPVGEWESMRSALERMDEAVTEAVQNGDGSACLVTHGLIMSAYMGTITDVDPLTLWSQLEYPDVRTLDFDRRETHGG